MRPVTSILGSIRGLAIIGASLVVAACGSSQNWKDSDPTASIGGTVTGLNGGTLALWNNGGDRLAISGNGPFTFPLQIAHGSDYVVVVATQPAGQTCTVTKGSGTAPGNVNSITVTCQAEVFTRRPLPAIYETGKAVNYSPYRTAGGPITFEVPSDAEILQDLRLLDVAGFNLLRLFGARAPATDVVAEKILRLAAQNFPDMRFQLGVELKGLTSCSQTDNDYNIAYLISNLSKYPNVVTISVGNETSFFSRYMPLPCLEGYIRAIRSQVTQPVTADDDWTFYAGKATFETSERVPVKPDTILSLIDFASIHMYPFSYTVWDWRQTDEPAGPERAKAMMEQSLVALKEWYGDVVAYQYVGADGVTVSVGDSMPITVGETGWKARQTNPAAEIEQFAALPANAKWYFDLLYGNPGGYPSWQGSVGGPPTIFYFEAFDEQWKGIDDGWGLWDISRKARYALCGLLPAGPVCKDDLYEDAGYFVASAFSTVTFDSPTTSYALVGFGGAEDSQVVADPSSPDYEEPSQNVLIVQGNYWMNPSWKFTYGLRRSEWSGQAQQCDYGPVSPVQSACFWDQPGFNYSDQLDKVYSAVSYDAILGAAYTRDKWTFTAGSVYLDKASTDNPVEWGQDNTAIFLNLGIYRDLPEISFGGLFKAEVYGGLGRVMFGRQGPAPLSMPNNIAFGGVDPRTSESGNFLTLGANLNF